MNDGRSEALGRRHALLLAAIVLVAVALRFGFLTSRGWWFDEALTVIGARLGVDEMLDHVLHNERSPPLYFLLIAAWGRVAGTTEAGLRSLSAAFGIATVWIAYAAAARLVSVRAGLVAAALAAMNPMLVWFSLEARMYALLVLLGGASFLSFVMALERPAAWTLAAWVAASALALWTHYFALALVAPEAAWLVLRHPRSRAVWASMVALALAAAALVPFAVAATKFTAWMARHDWLLRVAIVIPELFLGFQPPAPEVLAPIALLTPAVALWLLATRADATERRGAVTAAIVGGAAIFLPVLASLIPRFDLIMSRYLAAATVPLLVVVAAGLGARRAGWLGTATLVLTCLFGIAIDVGTAHVSKFGHEDWRGAAQAVGPVNRARAVVVTPARGRVPLQVYRPLLRELDASQAVVSEIVVVALPPFFRELGRPSVPPRPPSPAPPSAAFQMVQRTDAESFTLARYGAATAVPVDLARLAAMALEPDGIAVLLELPEPDAVPVPSR